MNLTLDSSLTSGTASLFSEISGESIQRIEAQAADFKQFHAILPQFEERSTPASFESNFLILAAGVMANLRKFKDRMDWVVQSPGGTTKYPIASQTVVNGPDRDTWTVPTQESKWIFSLPSGKFDELTQKIESSRQMLNWGDNWDGEGSLGYNEVTWTRAITLLRTHISWLWKRHGLIVEAPNILPGPNSSIDVHWRTKNFELLINIPDDPSAQASFYGDDYGQRSVKGTFDPTSYNFGLLTFRVVDLVTGTVSPWPRENIPYNDRLFMRVHQNLLPKSGELVPTAFRDQGEGMSTDWEKYSPPHDTKQRASKPSENGVIQMQAGLVEEIETLAVEHRPIADNRAHTDVLGEKTVEVRFRLSRVSQWVLPI